MGRRKKGVEDEIVGYEKQNKQQILSNLLTTSNICTSCLNNNLARIEKSVLHGESVNLKELKESVNIEELKEDSDGGQWEGWFECGVSLDLSEPSTSGKGDVIICFVGLKIHKLSCVSIVARSIFTDARVEQYQLYSLLLDAQKAAIKCLKPGNSLAKAHEALTSIIKDGVGTEILDHLVVGFGADKLDAEGRVLILGVTDGNIELTVGRKVFVSLGFRDLNFRDIDDSKYSLLISDMVFIRDKHSTGRIIQELDTIDTTLASPKIFPLILTNHQIIKLLPTLHNLPSKLQELVLSCLNRFSTLDRDLIRMLADYFCHSEAPLGVILRIMHDIIRLYRLRRVTDEDMVHMLIDPLLRSSVESGSIQRKLGLVHISDLVGYSISCLDHPLLFSLLQKSLLSRWSEATSIYNKLGLIRVINELLKKLEESEVVVGALVNIVSSYLADSFKTLEDSEFKDCPTLYEYLLLPIYSILTLNDKILKGVEDANSSTLDASKKVLSFCDSCRKFTQIRFIEHEKCIHKNINLALKVKEILEELFPPERQLFSSSARYKEIFIEPKGDIIMQFDWRTSAFRDIVLSSIIDQEDTCICYVIPVAESVWGAINLSKKDGVIPVLSSQHIADHLKGAPCLGYHYIISLEFVYRSGLPPEFDVPITGMQPIKPPTRKLSKLYYIADWMPLPEDEDIIKSLLPKQTIVITIPRLSGSLDSNGMVIDLSKVTKSDEGVYEHSILLVSL